MPTYRKGNYWNEYDQSDLFLFTGNGVVKNGRLVMGAGTAKQVKDHWPDIDLAIGKTIMSDCDEPWLGSYEYGLLISWRWPKAKIGVFQTKYDWKDDAYLDLIKLSTKQLYNWCYENPTARVDLPFPGIGKGNLNPNTVKPVINILPDQVIVWTAL